MYSQVITKQEDIFKKYDMDYHKNVEVSNRSQILAYIRSEPVFMMYAELPDDYECIWFNALKQTVEAICSKVLRYVDLGYKVFLNAKAAVSRDIERILTFKKGTFSNEFIIQDSKYLDKTFKDEYIITSQKVDSRKYYYTKEGYKTLSDISGCKKPDNEARELISRILSKGDINAIVRNNKYLKALVYSNGMIKFCLG